MHDLLLLVQPMHGSPIHYNSSNEFQRAFSGSGWLWRCKPAALSELLAAMQVLLLHHMDANVTAEEVQVFLWRLWCQSQGSEAHITMQVC